MQESLFSLAWWHHVGETTVEKIFSIALILFVALIIKFVASRLISLSLSSPWSREKLSEHQQKRLITLRALLNNLVGYILLFICGIQMIKVIGGERYDITPILTTAGVTGVAIGFGAQKLVRDTITGFFILLEDQYAVGDYVMINDTTGVIETVGMRITRIRDDQGRLTTLSNGDVVKVTNFSRGPVQSVVEFSVAANADLAQVTQAVEQVNQGFESEGLLEKPVLQGISSFDAAKLTFKIQIKADPKRQTEIQAQYREAIRAALVQAQLPLA